MNNIVEGLHLMQEQDHTGNIVEDIRNDITDHVKCRVM